MSRYMPNNSTADYVVKVQKAKIILGFSPTADVVEVVRCKDCTWWHDRNFDPILERREGCCDRPLGEYYECDCDFVTSENDYCSYGERREENEG